MGSHRVDRENGVAGLVVVLTGIVAAIVWLPLAVIGVFAAVALVTSFVWVPWVLIAWLA